MYAGRRACMSELHDCAWVFDSLHASATLNVWQHLLLNRNLTSGLAITTGHRSLLPRKVPTLDSLRTERIALLRGMAKSIKFAGKETRKKPGSSGARYYIALFMALLFWWEP